MSYAERYKDYVFAGTLAEPMSKYVTERRAVGRLFNKQSQMLARLDKMSLGYDFDKPELSREFVEKWCELQPNECRKNQRQRINFIRRFAEFMVRYGYTAYMANVKISTVDDYQFVPYVFTKGEIARIFHEIDNMKQNPHNPRAVYIFPALYRILYCCGLRANEALNLRISDVDTEIGVLSIKEAKHGNRRCVPMSPEMTARCKWLVSAIHKNSLPSDWFFPNARNDKMHLTAAYKCFRRFLEQAKISHGGKGNGPRLHDLRHTFAVHCLQKWVDEGANLQALLPYLSSYLGHCKLGGTQKYLHLTSEAHTGLIQQFQEYAGDIIPVLEALYEEE
jgi:integrase